MKKLLVLIGFAFLCMPSFAQNITCKELVTYRNTVLLKAWDKECRKYDAFYFYNSVIKSEMAKLSSMKNRTDWGAIALSIKSVTDVLSNTLNLSKFLKGAKKAKGVYKVILKEAKVRKSDFEKAIQEESDACIWEDIGNSIIEVIPIVNNLKATMDNIKTYNEYEKSKREIDNQLKNCQSKLAQVEMKLKNSSNKLTALNNIKNEIDAYLVKFCKSN